MILIMRYFGYLHFGLLASDLVIKTIWEFDIVWILDKLSVKHHSKSVKILLLGKRGQVGWELQRSLAPLAEVVALSSESQNYCGDLTNLHGLAESVRRIKPDVIVNATAHTAVDKAESEPELARTINVDAVAVLAREAKALDAWLVHYSTDYVFDGCGIKPWIETDMTSPLSVYGNTKLSGEQVIKEAGCKHLIFRTSWVYGVRGNNFSKTKYIPSYILKCFNMFQSYPSNI